MRTVLKNTSEVVHTFAQRTQNEGRAGNIFFEKRDFIYSFGHHYLLAQFITEKDIIINDSGYSISTGKHIAAVRYATRQYNQWYITEIHPKKVLDKMSELSKKIPTARKPEKYIDKINYLYNSFTTFQKFLSESKIKSELKEAKSGVIYRAIVKINKSVQPNNIQQFTEKVKAQREAEKRKEAKRIKSLLSDFYSYKRDSIRIGGEDFIRISQDGESIETSQQVKVPINEARVLYKAIAQGIDIKGHRIGNYTVNSLNGVLTIGCHRINIESVHRTGKQII